MINQRQKIIRLADESELGWKVVDEYTQSEIASDEEDQKKIHRGQARARVRLDQSGVNGEDVTHSTDPGQRILSRRCRIKNIKREHSRHNKSNSSSTASLECAFSVVRWGTGRPTVRQTEEIII